MVEAVANKDKRCGMIDKTQELAASHAPIVCFLWSTKKARTWGAGIFFLSRFL